MQINDIRKAKDPATHPTPTTNWRIADQLRGALGRTLGQSAKRMTVNPGN